MLNHLALFHCCLQGDEDIEDDRNYDHESTTLQAGVEVGHLT